jgi:LDH2 family malate/lactate/ureidoglycolate dehydrogenase
MVGMISRAVERAPSAKMTTLAPTEPESVNTPPEGGKPLTCTPLWIAAPASVALSAKLWSKVRRSR